MVRFFLSPLLSFHAQDGKGSEKERNVEGFFGKKAVQWLPHRWIRRAAYTLPSQASWHLRPVLISIHPNGVEHGFEKFMTEPNDEELWSIRNMVWYWWGQPGWVMFFRKFTWSDQPIPPRTCIYLQNFNSSMLQMAPKVTYITNKTEYSKSSSSNCIQNIPSIDQFYWPIIILGALVSIKASTTTWSVFISKD